MFEAKILSCKFSAFESKGVAHERAILKMGGGKVEDMGLSFDEVDNVEMKTARKDGM